MADVAHMTNATSLLFLLPDVFTSCPAVVYNPLLCSTPVQTPGKGGPSDVLNLIQVSHTSDRGFVCKNRPLGSFDMFMMFGPTLPRPVSPALLL